MICALQLAASASGSVTLASGDLAQVRQVLELSTAQLRKAAPVLLILLLAPAVAQVVRLPSQPEVRLLAQAAPCVLPLVPVRKVVMWH